MTRTEVFELINNKLDHEKLKLFNSRFEIVFDDIPTEHPTLECHSELKRGYCDDDGLYEYHWFIFKDKKNNEEYFINIKYQYYADNEIMDLPDNIEIVEEGNNTVLTELKDSVV